MPRFARICSLGW